MAKETILYGEVKFRERSISEDLTARILGIDANGNLVDRPAIDGAGFITTALADGRVWIGSAGGAATAVDTASVGDIDADSVLGLTIKAGTIVDADINGAAAIAKSKLALAGTIVNADISGAAAIAYSKLALSGAIVNADIAAAAAIARTKFAAGTPYRILANNNLGAMSENAAITADRAVISDTNGQLTHSATTAAQLGYSSTLTGDIQSQLDNEIATKTVKAIVKAPTVAEHGYAITWDNAAGEWDLTDPVTQGIPTGGNTRQVLAKVDGTDWNAAWMDLVLSDITDLSAVVADLNLLAGADAGGLTSTHLSHLIGTSSNLQDQIDAKQSSALAHNAIWIGNSSGIATALSPGTDGYVLTSVSGVPTWQAVSGSGGSPPGANTQIVFNDGGIFGADAGLTYDKVADLLQVTGQSIFTANDGITGNTTTVLALTHTTTGAPSNGIGTGLSFVVETSGGNNETGGIIQVNASDVTPGSEDFDMSLRVMIGGALATERLRLGSQNIILTADTASGGYIELLAEGQNVRAVTGATSVLDLRSATTSIVGNVLSLRRTTTGTAANGIGAGLLFEVENGSGTTKQGVTIEAVATDVTAGSEDFDIVFKSMTAGAAVNEKLRITSAGRVGIGTTPTARLHLPAGTATASTAPLKFTEGVALGTPEDGAMEYHDDHLWFTQGSTRHQLDVLYTKEVVLTPSDILNLHTTPVEIVPAPGVGKHIRVLSVSYVMEGGTTNYVKSGGDPFVSIYYGASSTFIHTTFSTLITDPADTFSYQSPSTMSGNSRVATSVVENQALNFANSVPAASYTTGDRNLRIIIVYQITNI